MIKAKVYESLRLLLLHVETVKTILIKFDIELAVPLATYRLGFPAGIPARHN